MNNYNIINVDNIESTMMNNKEMIKQFISLYLSQSPIDFQAIASAINISNHAQISSTAHHIKPTMEYVGASNLRIQFQELENLGKQGADINLIKSLFNNIQLNFNVLLEELQTYYDHITFQDAD